MSYIECNGKRVVINGNSFIIVPSSQLSLLSNLTAYWKLEETSGNALDSTGNGYYGTVSDVSQGQIGKINNGYKFGGTSGTSISLPSSITSGTSYTISMWVYPNSPSGEGVLFIQDSGSGLSLLSNYNLQWWKTSGTQSTGALTNLFWNHVAITVNAGSGTFYINGVARGTFTDNTSNSFNRMGALGSDRFKGSLDEIGFWNRALSFSEILELYNSGYGLSYPFNVQPVSLLTDLTAYWKLDDAINSSCNDSVGSNLLGVDGAIANVNGLINKAYSFDGTNDKLLLSNSITLSKYNITLSLWYFPTSLLDSDRTIFAETLGSPSYWWQYAIHQDTWKTRNVSTGTMGARTNDLTLPTLTLNSWNHLVFVYSVNQNIKSIYKNGVKEASTSIDIKQLTTERVFNLIGADSDVTYNPAIGKLDEIGVWDRALSPLEVTALYNNGYGLAYPFSAPSILTDGSTIVWLSFEVENITKNSSDFISVANDLTPNNHDADVVYAYPKWISPNILRLGEGGSADGLSAYLGDGVLPQPATVYAVMNQTSYNTGSPRLIQFNGDNALRLIQPANQNPGTLMLVPQPSTNIDASIGEWCIVTMKMDGSDGSLQVDQHTPIVGNTGTMDLLQISLAHGEGKVEFKEVIARKTIDTSSNEAAIYSYLRNKHFPHEQLLNDGSTGAWYTSETQYLTMDNSYLISQWSDRSGNSRHLYEDEFKPLYTSEGVHFSNNNIHLTTNIAEPEPTMQLPICIYTVFKTLTAISQTNIWSYDDAIALYVHPDNLLMFLANTAPGYPWLAYTPNAFLITRTFSNGANGKFQINQNTPNTGNYGNETATTLGMGGYDGSLYIKEMIVRNAVDTSANETIIYNYLRQKYFTSEKITNGTFADTTGWDVSTGYTIIPGVGAYFDNAGTSYIRMTDASMITPMAMTANSNYNLQFDISTTGVASIYILNYVYNNAYIGNNDYGNGHHSINFTDTNPSGICFYTYFIGGGNGFTIKNISLKEIV